MDMRTVRRMRLLLIDKSAHMRWLLRTALEDMGFGFIDEAGNATAAARAMGSVMPDAVISGLTLHRCSGLALCGLVRKGKVGCDPHVPFLLLTAHADRDTVVKARDIGVDMVLAKPVTPQLLVQRLMAALAERPPFVNVGGYAGPDRRRRRRPVVHERRREAVPVQLHEERCTAYRALPPPRPPALSLSA